MPPCTPDPLNADTGWWYHATARAFATFDPTRSSGLDANAYLGVHFARTPEPTERIHAERLRTQPDVTGQRTLIAALRGNARHFGSESLLAAEMWINLHHKGLWDAPQFISLADASKLQRLLQKELQPYTRTCPFQKVARAFAEDPESLKRGGGHAALALLDIHLALLGPREYAPRARTLALHLRETLLAQNTEIVTYANQVEGGDAAVALSLGAIRDPFDPTQPWHEPRGATVQA